MQFYLNSMKTPENYFGHFLSILRQEFFLDFCLLFVYRFLSPSKSSEKLMNRYREKLATDERTDGRTHNHECIRHRLPGDKK